ncbi:MAG: photosystem II reaction center protein Ycf12 [Aphanocapsa feldmannii 277cV]|uniref:Photosystem II reaction center protein Psb30 n=2 Tax=Aphanocapsa feldmannii TaxID=192050 RepID=A0A524RPD4_9CHRO|nr:MAG: photosystem II reaction center protein Ycf12 [Aphanocapsa feldmannii 288cV]TGG93688.1 MAG: photosystem II reaction center protein Ycf12 [Aphanocapsa feldmannii 277cV]TGH27827.1 MAG: photosystem II reaction center protein Ycf12 [Aphanocapsa feldmannii 277cI]
MGIDINLVAGFVSLGLIFLAGPAVIFIIFARRGSL